MNAVAGSRPASAAGDGDHHGRVVGAFDGLVVLARTPPGTARSSVASPRPCAHAGEQVVARSAPSAGSPTSERARIQSSHGYTSASWSSVRPNHHGSLGSTWVACARSEPLRAHRNVADLDAGGDAVVVAGAIEPVLFVGRLAAVLDHALVHGHQASLRPDGVVQLLRLPRLAQLRVPGRVAGTLERRHARCRAPAGDRGAGSHAGRRRR